MSTKMPKLVRVLSETSRFCCYLALAALFVCLISISTTIYPFLLHPTSLLPYFHQFLSSFSIQLSETEIPPQLIVSLPFLLSVFFVSSTHGTTVHKFHDQAIKLVSSHKSIIVSFFPFLSPILVQAIVLVLISFAFCILKLLQYTMLVLLGCNMDYNSIYFLVFIFHIAALLAGLLIYFGVEWCLMNPISQEVFAPLKYLVKGMRVVAFLMMMLYGCVSGFLSGWSMVMMANYADNNFYGPTTASLVLQILVFAAFMLTLLYCNLVVETVFIRLLFGEIALCGDSMSQIDEKSGVETMC